MFMTGVLCTVYGAQVYLNIQMYMYFKAHVHVIAKEEGTIVLQMNIYNVH